MFDSKESVFKRGYKLSWANNFSASEKTLLVLALFSPILLTKENEWIFILYIAMFISTTLSVRDKRSTSPHQWGLIYKIVFAFSFLVLFLTLTFLVLVKNGFSINNPIVFLVILVGFFGFLSVLFISSILLLNLLFFIFLKLIFPYDNGNNSEVSTYKLKELSPFMSLPTQVAYLLLRIFYFFIYLIFVSMVFGWIAKISNEKSENNRIATIEDWFVNSGFITLGNTVGILSLLLTLLTITIPISYRLINTASNEYELKKESK